MTIERIVTDRALAVRTIVDGAMHCHVVLRYDWRRPNTTTIYDHAVKDVLDAMERDLRASLE